eukprot:882364-Amphidinium_carterae.1
MSFQRHQSLSFVELLMPIWLREGVKPDGLARARSIEKGNAEVEKSWPYKSALSGLRGEQRELSPDELDKESALSSEDLRPPPEVQQHDVWATSERKAIPSSRSTSLKNDKTTETNGKLYTNADRIRTLLCSDNCIPYLYSSLYFYRAMFRGCAFVVRVTSWALTCLLACSARSQRRHTEKSNRESNIVPSSKPLTPVTKSWDQTDKHWETQSALGFVAGNHKLNSISAEKQDQNTPQKRIILLSCDLKALRDNLQWWVVVLSNARSLTLTCERSLKSCGNSHYLRQLLSGNSA